MQTSENTARSVGTMFSESSLVESTDPDATRWHQQADWPLEKTTSLGRLRPVSAKSSSHIGELFQAPVVGPDGSIVTGLITLPDSSLWAKVVLIPLPGHDIVMRAGFTKVRRAVELTFEFLGEKCPGLEIWIEDNIIPGVGMGSSTCHCTAGVLAACRMCKRKITDLDVMTLVYRAEGPCDPLAAIDWGVVPIWASRAGFLVDIIPRPLPRLVALGFVTDRRSVSTDELARRTVYTDADVLAAAPVFEAAKKAILSGSAADLALAATASATLNQTRCATPFWRELNHIAKKVGAAGVAASHSGTAASLLWTPQTESLRSKIDEARQWLMALGATSIHPFSTSKSPSLRDIGVQGSLRPPACLPVGPA